MTLQTNQTFLREHFEPMQLAKKTERDRGKKKRKHFPCLQLKIKHCDQQ